MFVIKVVGVTFKDKGKVYYFSPGRLNLKPNITVIVQTERGIQFGKVEMVNIELDEKQLDHPLQRVVRIASKKDYQEHRKNLKDAKDALKKGRELSEKLGLNMQMIDATFTFDRSQLMFQFMADNRVDFRDLAKELASIYHTRIELRQIGVRDKAKEVGGIGPCGRVLCCHKFLSDFDSVSINMAKNQNIALNPTKINGCCGRLLCCLKYEDEQYAECRKCLPHMGSKVKTEHGEGRVVSIDVLKKSYKVDVPEVGIVEVSAELWK